MNCKQIISSLFVLTIVLLVGISISWQSVSANVDSTPTSVWPPPTQPTKTYQQMLEAYKEGWLEFEDAVARSDFDFTCPIPCWSTFKPGMPFYQLIDAWEAKRGWRPFIQGGDKNSSFGVQGYTLSITVLSDASSPDLLLRAYIIHIQIPIEPYNGLLPPAEVYAALPETVRNFLPTAHLISTPPRSILVGTLKRYYTVTSVVYEYQSWAIQYFYRARPRPNQPNCSEHELYGMSIWVYSDAELGFQSLWQDIQQNYLLAEIRDLSVEGGKLPAIAFQTLDTQAFKEARQAGKCLPLDSQ